MKVYYCIVLFVICCSCIQKSYAQLESVQDIILYGELFLLIDQEQLERGLREVKFEIDTDYFQNRIRYIFGGNGMVVHKIQEHGNNEYYENKYNLVGDSLVVTMMIPSNPILNQKTIYKLFDKQIIFADYTSMLSEPKEMGEESFYFYSFTDTTICLSNSPFPQSEKEEISYNLIFGYQEGRISYKETFFEGEKMLDFRIKYSSAGEIDSFHYYLTSKKWPYGEHQWVEFQKTNKSNLWKVIQSNSQKQIGNLILTYLKK